MSKYFQSQQGKQRHEKVIKLLARFVVDFKVRRTEGSQEIRHLSTSFNRAYFTWQARNTAGFAGILTRAKSIHYNES